MDSCYDKSGLTTLRIPYSLWPNITQKSICIPEHRNRGIGLGFSSMEPQQPYVNPRAMEHHQPYVNPHVRQTEAQAAGYGQQPGSLGHHPGHQGQGYGGHQGNQSVNPFGGGRGGRGGFGINFVKKM